MLIVIRDYYFISVACQVKGLQRDLQKDDLFLVFGVRNFYSYPKVLGSDLRRKVLL